MDVSLIEDYGRWYCNDCKQYLPDEAPGVAPTPPPPAPTPSQPQRPPAQRAAPQKSAPPPLPKKKGKGKAIAGITITVVVLLLLMSWMGVLPFLGFLKGPVDSISGTISAATGGQLSMEGAAIDIPGESMIADTQIIISKITGDFDIPIPNIADLASGVYDFGPDGTTFDPTNKPSMTLDYDPDKLPEGIDESYLALFQGSGGKWEKVQGSVVDMESNKVAGKVDHFSDFAIMYLPTPSLDSFTKINLLKDQRTGEITRTGQTTNGKIQLLNGTFVGEKFLDDITSTLSYTATSTCEVAGGSASYNSVYFGLDDTQTVGFSIETAKSVLIERMDGPMPVGDFKASAYSWNEKSGAAPESVELAEGYYKMSCGMRGSPGLGSSTVMFKGTEFQGTVVLKHNGVEQRISTSQMWDNGRHGDFGINDGIWAFEAVTVLMQGENTFRLSVLDNDDAETSASSDFTVTANIESMEFRVTLNWNTDYNDFDLHLYDPDENHIYWNDKDGDGRLDAGGSSGGLDGLEDGYVDSSDQDTDNDGILNNEDTDDVTAATLDVDDMDGFGPEVITKTKATSGNYTIEVIYFGDNAGTGLPVQLDDVNVTLTVETKGLRKVYNHIFTHDDVGTVWTVEIEVPAENAV